MLVRSDKDGKLTISCVVADPARPISKMTVGRTVLTPHPPIEWKIQISVNVGNVGSWKRAFTCLQFHVLASDVG